MRGLLQLALVFFLSASVQARSLSDLLTWISPGGHHEQGHHIAGHVTRGSSSEHHVDHHSVKHHLVDQNSVVHNSVDHDPVEQHVLYNNAEDNEPPQQKSLEHDLIQKDSELKDAVTHHPLEHHHTTHHSIYHSVHDPLNSKPEDQETATHHPLEHHSSSHHSSTHHLSEHVTVNPNSEAQDAVNRHNIEPHSSYHLLPHADVHDSVNSNLLSHPHHSVFPLKHNHEGHSVKHSQEGDIVKRLLDRSVNLNFEEREVTHPPPSLYVDHQPHHLESQNPRTQHHWKDILRHDNELSSSGDRLLDEGWGGEDLIEDHIHHRTSTHSNENLSEPNEDSQTKDLNLVPEDLNKLELNQPEKLDRKSVSDDNDTEEGKISEDEEEDVTDVVNAYDVAEKEITSADFNLDSKSVRLIWDGQSAEDRSSEEDDNHESLVNVNKQVTKQATKYRIDPKFVENLSKILRPFFQGSDEDSLDLAKEHIINKVTNGNRVEILPLNPIKVNKDNKAPLALILGAPNNNKGHRTYFYSKRHKNGHVKANVEILDDESEETASKNNKKDRESDESKAVKEVNSYEIEEEVSYHDKAKENVSDNDKTEDNVIKIYKTDENLNDDKETDDVHDIVTEFTTNSHAGRTVEQPMAFISIAPTNYGSNSQENRNSIIEAKNKYKTEGKLSDDNETDRVHKQVTDLTNIHLARKTEQPVAFINIVPTNYERDTRENENSVNDSEQDEVNKLHDVHRDNKYSEQLNGKVSADDNYKSVLRNYDSSSSDSSGEDNSESFDYNSSDSSMSENSSTSEGDDINQAEYVKKTNLEEDDEKNEETSSDSDDSGSSGDSSDSKYSSGSDDFENYLKSSKDNVNETKFLLKSEDVSKENYLETANDVITDERGDEEVVKEVVEGKHETRGIWGISKKVDTDNRASGLELTVENGDTAKKIVLNFDKNDEDNAKVSCKDSKSDLGTHKYYNLSFLFHR